MFICSKRERVRKRCKQEHRGRQAVPMVGEYALRNAPDNISECKVSLAARWLGPALNPYHERNPNSEAEFLASFWQNGGAGWNALRARRARALRWNRDCSTHARHGQIARHGTSHFCDITELAKFRH